MPRAQVFVGFVLQTLKIFAHAFHVPMVIFDGWRGEQEGRRDKGNKEGQVD
jgi:hypothetical protein